MTALPTDPTNADQLHAWDGAGGAFWTAHADRFDEGVARYQPRFLAAAAIRATDTVLDVGCGNGRTTCDAARRASRVLGVDLSSSMLELAARRAAREQRDNVSFLQADAQCHAFAPASFDVVLSRHGSMFFGDPEAAFGNIARAVAPGGRLVLLTWQPLAAQEWLRAFRSALGAGRDLPPVPTTSPGPLSLSDPGRVRGLLGASGFADVQITGLTEPMFYGVDVDDAFRFVSALHAGMTDGLDEETRDGALAALRADLAGHATERGVLYGSATWLVQARRP